MNLYLIKWESGDIGIFSATTKNEMLLLLDQFADPTTEKFKKIPKNIPVYLDNKGDMGEELLVFIDSLDESDGWDTINDLKLK
jgi:hypothetical protein